MKLSMEQFRDRLVDYLYGELEGEALRDFENCLAESEACRSELAAFQRTLRHSRSALQNDDAPPARVRSAVLAAAAAQVRGVHSIAAAMPAQAARHAPVAAAPAPKRAPVREEAPSLWAWLRTPWLLPTLGVAAAVAVVVLNKQVESPDMHRDERAAPAGDGLAKQGAAAPSVAPAPAAVSEAESDSLAGAAATGGGAEGHVAPSKAKPAAIGSGGAAQPARRSANAVARKGYATPPADWARLRGDDKSEERAVERERSLDDFAKPAPPAEEPAMEKSARAPGLAAPAPAAPARAAPAPAASMHAEESAFGGAAADRAPAARAAPAGPATEAKKRGVVLTREQLIERAQAQSAAKSYDAALESYAELLRRFPDDRLAKSWREQQATLRALRVR